MAYRILTGIEFFALCALFSVQVNAQENPVEIKADKKTNLLIDISGGYTTPMGNYTKTDYWDTNSGFAGNGYNIGLNGVWMFNNHFGLAATVSFHNFSFNGLQTIADSLHRIYAIDSASVQSLGSNHTVNLAVGVDYRLPISKKLSLRFKLMTGAVFAQLAGYENLIENQAASTFSQKSSSATALGVQLSLIGTYMLTDKIYVGLNFDYFYSKPNFKIEYQNRNNSEGRYLTDYCQPITGINTNFLVGYLFRTEAKQVFRFK